MNYEQSLSYLNELGKFGIRLGMERIEALLADLGNPEKKFKTIHVTGTNGKGSVTSMLGNVLLAAGLNVGKFTSPHFVKYNERIELGGRAVSDKDFATIITRVAEAVATVKKQGVEQPTQFEILTAAAFLYFAQNQVDYAVIEVGLGGLWDSTNVIIPQVSVITNVALDHMNRLGNTLEAIAEQKAGIIKAGIPVVTAAEGRALKPIEKTCATKKAPLYVYNKDFFGKEITSSMAGQTMHITCFGNTCEYKCLLAGEHQIINTAVAVMTARLLAEQDVRICAQAIYEGVSKTKWPGRLERIALKPDIILDGAHNPNGALALRAALDKYYKNNRRFFVFGMMADKNMAEVAQILFRFEDKVFTVLADNGTRACSADKLARIVGNNAESCVSIGEAYKAALSQAGINDVVCICGSLYLVGTFKSMQQKG